jgi:hypothetical protein
LAEEHARRAGLDRQESAGGRGSLRPSSSRGTASSRGSPGTNRSPARSYTSTGRQRTALSPSSICFSSVPLGAIAVTSIGGLPHVAHRNKRGIPPAAPACKRRRSPRRWLPRATSPFAPSSWAQAHRAAKRFRASLFAAGGGHHRRSLTPSRCGRTSRRRPCPRYGSTWARREKALAAMCAPKGVGPRAPRTFLLQKGYF